MACNLLFFNPDIEISIFPDREAFLVFVSADLSANRCPIAAYNVISTQKVYNRIRF